jgi:hypothetical protein
LWWGNGRERDRLEDLGIDGRILLKLILKIVWEGVDWIHMAQDRVKWQAVLKAVT